MRLIFAGLILLLVLITSAQCQQTAENWFDKGLALYGQGKYEESIRAYDEVIRLDPKLPAAWFNKGLALDDYGKYDEAIHAYDEAIKLNPNYAKAWCNKGNSLIDQATIVMPSKLLTRPLD